MTQIASPQSSVVSVELLSASETPSYIVNGSGSARVRKVSLYVDVYVPYDSNHTHVDAALETLKETLLARAPNSIEEAESITPEEPPKDSSDRAVYVVYHDTGEIETLSAEDFKQRRYSYTRLHSAYDSKVWPEATSPEAAMKLHTSLQSV